MKISLVLALCLCFLVPVGTQAQPVCPPGGISFQQGQGQGQSSINTIIGGTQVMQVPSSGDSSGGGQQDIYRSFPVPMYPASAPNYPYFGGPYRWGRQLLALQKLIRYKNKWTSGELEALTNRPGELNKSENFFASFGFSPFVEFTVDQPFDGEDLRRFQRSYEVIGEVGLDGFKGADSEKIMGYAGSKACQHGGNLVMLIQQDGNFRMDSRSRYTTIGISPTGMTGGAGAVGGSAVLFSHTWGSAQVGYDTEPHATFIVFRATGVRYVPYHPTPAVVQQPQPGQPAAGVTDAKGKNQILYQKPTPSVLLQERQQ